MALRSLYLASTGGDSLKSAIALGLIDAWRGQVDRLAVFRPLVNRVDEPEPLCELLRSQATVALSWSEPLGATYQEAYANPTAAGAKILERYLAVAERSDLVIVLGSDLAGPAEASGLALDARIAADLSCPVVLVTDGLRQSPAAARTALAVAERTLAEYHASWVGAIINRCETGELATMRQQMATLPVLNMVVPENRQVSAPTVRAVMEAVDGQLVAGSNRLLDQEAALLTVGALEPEHMLSTVKNGALVITPGDRAEMLLALVAAHADSSFSSLAGVILSGDFQPSQAMMRLITGIDANLPIIRSPLNTMTTASRAAAVRGHLTLNTAAKNQAAIALVREHVDTAGLWQAVESFTPKVVTPQRFAYSLLERARHDPKHIVLPEGSDLRILQAAARLVAMSAAELTVIGVPEQVSALAQQHDLDLTGVTIQDPQDSDLVERLAPSLHQIRQAKGMTLEQARQTLLSSTTYLGTMMVQEGLADGMVSGAIHTTADTIRPAFQIIKTVPGTAIVSSVFLMALADKVLVFGDCAVNPNPTPEQLADIAISSAATAAKFGIEPRVALLSYSTGTSGAGPDVDAVSSAVSQVTQRSPELLVDGPIQYDAAVDPVVAASKLPNSPVAGQATVLVFPDLGAGNIAYKAVQRSAGALAIGPVLQGLRKPVNDLSRGALVDDIVNTVIITAIQAQ